MLFKYIGGGKHAFKGEDGVLRFVKPGQTVKSETDLRTKFVNKFELVEGRTKSREPFAELTDAELLSIAEARELELNDDLSRAAIIRALLADEESETAGQKLEVMHEAP